MNEPTTQETVSALQRAGIPIIGTTNSMDTAYPFYFQLAPDDRREAQVGTDYLRRLRRVVHGVRMVDTTSGYTRELGADVARDLSPAQRQAMPALHYSSPSQLAALAAKACTLTRGQLNLIYYLGRSQDLYWLINRGLANSARCAGNTIKIVSGDDASKFSGELPSDVTLDYTALTFPPAWSTCSRDQNVPQFYQNYLGWLRSVGIHGLPRNPLRDPLLLDGHTVLGYDAVSAMQNAAAQVYEYLTGPGASPGAAGIRVTPGEVWGQLSSRIQPPGANGPITFQSGYEHQRFVPVVQLRLGQFPAVVYAEGTLFGGRPSGCPGS